MASIRRMHSHRVLPADMWSRHAQSQTAQGPRPAWVCFVGSASEAARQGARPAAATVAPSRRVVDGREVETTHPRGGTALFCRPNPILRRTGTTDNIFYRKVLCTQTSPRSSIGLGSLAGCCVCFVVGSLAVDDLAVGRIAHGGPGPEPPCPQPNGPRPTAGLGLFRKGDKTRHTGKRA